MERGLPLGLASTEGLGATRCGDIVEKKLVVEIVEAPSAGDKIVRCVLKIRNLDDLLTTEPLLSARRSAGFSVKDVIADQYQASKLLSNGLKLTPFF